jgi:CheY-like chemotaxis protein
MPVILLIENDEGDVFLFRRALSRLNYDGAVRVVGSVSEARAYLEGSGRFTDRGYFPIPDLIVSDMNLTGQSGNDFLAWLREQEAFNKIPFVFLSGSFGPADAARARELRAGEFFVKSGDINLMVERVAHMLKLIPPLS